jgi:hypothetical protein
MSSPDSIAFNGAQTVGLRGLATRITPRFMVAEFAL